MGHLGVFQMTKGQKKYLSKYILSAFVLVTCGYVSGYVLVNATGWTILWVTILTFFLGCLIPTRLMASFITGIDYPPLYNKGFRMHNPQEYDLVKEETGLAFIALATAAVAAAIHAEKLNVMQQGAAVFVAVGIVAGIGRRAYYWATLNNHFLRAMKQSTAK
jgi:hypothetical protein